jgi:hypothetical protein
MNNDNGSGSGSGSGRASGGVYLRKLQFEIPYSVASDPQNRYRAQDLTIAATTQLQDTVSTLKAGAASAESTIWSRYGIAYKQWADFITGFPEYLK